MSDRSTNLFLGKSARFRWHSISSPALITPETNGQSMDFTIAASAVVPLTLEWTRTEIEFPSRPGIGRAASQR